ncbi:MAG: hypothetical protein KKF78_01555 [Candidatus Omnitrophica bacterium]|nr:hypothetical protein [Candidatus Omnitrophota bacterium]MBU1995821.1 hypothetical protein [Candidatus Omnitrophota bacterium]
MSNSKYWQCQKCTGILEKGLGGAAAVIGTATCSYCGAQYSQTEIYGGKWDVEVLDFTPPGRIRCIGYGFNEPDSLDKLQRIVSQNKTDKSCFIATACYGSSDVYDVKLLREYRDRVLLTNRFGRAFVNTYYYISPPVADFIRTRKALCQVIRGVISRKVVPYVKKKLNTVKNKEVL